MKILFISRLIKGNFSPIVVNQANSLINYGVKVEHFGIKGKGFLGYFTSIPRLRKIIKSKKYTAYHAHFSYAAATSALAGANPLIISLMGSDINRSKRELLLTRILVKLFGRKCIVKSEDMKRKLSINSVVVIPNGVDIDKFKPVEKKIALEKTRWVQDKVNILFAANPSRPEKNFALALEAFKLVKEKIPNSELHGLNEIPFENMVYYHNASDVVLLTSKYEGSPNVIKEALACNRPIVSLDVGDVKQLISHVEGCFIAQPSPKDLAEKIIKALTCKNTNGRENIRHLYSQVIAKKLIEVYNFRR